jgi:GrpB-like predicted nucleotidyltransferase (UPF0157 family)
MDRPVTIVDYNAQWREMFKQERARIMEAVGAHLIALEHIGSTSVPGLDAKAIIDMMAGVMTLDVYRRCVEPLSALGYEYVPDYEDELPERRYFRRRVDGIATHHLHMVVINGPFWERHILFRDYLRAHRDVARQYARLKRDLAAQYGTDRRAYNAAKTEFITSIEKRAFAERGDICE